MDRIRLWWYRDGFAGTGVALMIRIQLCWHWHGSDGTDTSLMVQIRLWWYRYGFANTGVTLMAQIRLWWYSYGSDGTDKALMAPLWLWKHRHGFRGAVWLCCRRRGSEVEDTALTTSARLWIYWRLVKNKASAITIDHLKKLTFSIKTNLYESIKSYLINLKLLFSFLEEDIFEVDKHKMQKEN